MSVSQSDLEAAMAGSLRLNSLPEPVPEYPFAQAVNRKWRFDFAYPESMVAIECEGGAWTGGRHTRGAGMQADMEKYNFAGLRGWLVLRFNNKMIESNCAADTVRAALLLRGGL